MNSKTVIMMSLILFLITCEVSSKQIPEEPYIDVLVDSEPVKNIVVYREKGRFCAWPANNGAWSWGNEILVAFSLHYYSEIDRDVDPTEHHVDWDKPHRIVMARSKNGGETWELERPDAFSASVNSEEAVPCPGDINFTHPDFAMRMRRDFFNITYDRGKTWQGPYKFPDFNASLNARTDYVVNGRNDCTLFISSHPGPFCVRTTDGAKTFNVLSKMKPPVNMNPRVRSIMPSTVRISGNVLLTAVRQLQGEAYVGWIDTYISKDNGNSWQYHSKVADADKRFWNSNPPSMVKLKDGRLCVTYGYRAYPYGIRAKLSSDNGRTWAKEIILRQDGRNWDLGYTRSFQRPDGKLVTIYYYATEEYPQEYIAATIWDPDAVNELSLDRLKIRQMFDCTTGIEKSIKEIQQLSQAEKPNVNQMVFWTQEKENYADALKRKVSTYFLGRRIKPLKKQSCNDHSANNKILNILHEILLYSDKAKQSNELRNVEKLKSLLSDFSEQYLKQ